MKQAYKIFLFLNLALLLVCSVAMAGETKQYNKDPIIKFFKMGQSEMTTIAPTNALGREINQLYALLTWIGVGIMAIVVISDCPILKNLIIGSLLYCLVSPAMATEQTSNKARFKNKKIL